MTTIDTRITAWMIAGVVSFVALAASSPTKGIAQEDHQSTVYFGEVDSKTDQVITLNVTPCQNRKTLQRISPYAITDLSKVSCSSGKQYTRVTVQERKPNPPPTGLIENTADKKKDDTAKPKPETSNKNRDDEK